MKIKNLFPLAFALITQMSFGQNNPLRMSAFDKKKDSIDNIVKEKVRDDFKRTLTYKYAPMAAEVDSSALRDTAQYRLFQPDSNNCLQPGYFDLRKEVAAFKDKKKGFVFQAAGTNPEDNANFFLSMKNAESMIAAADTASKEFGNPQYGIYLHLHAYPSVSLRANSFIKTQVEKLDAPAYPSGIIFTSRFLQATNKTAVSFAINHEDGHDAVFSAAPLFFKTKKEFFALEKPQQDSILQITEFGADHEGAQKTGYAFAQKALSSTMMTDFPQYYDNDRTWTSLHQNFIENHKYQATGDHPSFAQRKYFLYLCEMYESNKDLYDVIESLVPEKALPVWKMKYEKK